MVYAVEFNGTFRNATRRDAVAAAVQTRLADFARFGIDNISTDLKAANGLLILVRFLTEADRDVFWADMLSAFGSGINGPVAGAWASKHDCNHDGPHSTDCLVTETVTF